MTISLQQLLKAMVEQDASDLHITVGAPPSLRIGGKMVKVKIEPLNAQQCQQLAYSVLTDTQKKEFEKNKELDASFGIKNLARFRCNMFYQRGAIAGVFRRIPFQIPTFDQLGLPSVINKMIGAANGLILITGPTGSGKSTTLAAILDKINREEHSHILTIEDPIEFVHAHKNSIVNQREVGSDTGSFSNALKRLLRQDPDVVLVGEMRDLETIEMALTIAETGHLVFGTLHTNSTVQTINRIINVFPADQQSQIRQLVSFVLQGIVAQNLVPKSYEPGRTLVQEVLVPTPGIRNLIREEKVHQIYSAMQIGQDQTGMITMNQSLLNLVKQGVIKSETAVEYSPNPDEMEKMLGMKATG